MPNPAPKLSICIISHFAYGAMTGGRSGHIGGVEWQTSLTAKWLAAKGYTVSMLTWDEGGPAEEQIDGVRVIKICPQEAGLRGLRFLHPRWSSLIQALRRANADVYYHNCGEAVTGQIALWCRMNGRRFVFSSANDTDCDASLPEFKGLLERGLYRHGLRHADRIIVQTDTQVRLLREGFGLNAVAIPMPCPGQAEKDFVPRSQPVSHRVLWMARIWIQKRPDRFLDVAEACPDLEFDLVGPYYEKSYSQEVIRRARSMPNVKVHGPISRDRVGEFYQRAGCFCSTSDYEGFPNTFLESWSYGLPIVSTFDPDSRIKNERLGVVAQDTQGVIDGIRTLFSSPDYYREASLNTRRYYAENHTIETVMPQFEKVFCSASAFHITEPQQNIAMTGDALKTKPELAQKD